MADAPKRDTRKVVLLVAVLLVAAAFGALAAKGVAPARVQFAPTPDAFRDLFKNKNGSLDFNGIRNTRTGLNWDAWFILTYVAALVAWIWHTGRARYLGSKPWTVAATVVAVAAGVLDLLENGATYKALNAIKNYGGANVLPINHYATAKWIVLGAVGSYFWLRALQTPRRRPARTGEGFESVLPGVPPP